MCGQRETDARVEPEPRGCCCEWVHRLERWCRSDEVREARAHFRRSAAEMLKGLGALVGSRARKPGEPPEQGGEGFRRIHVD
jgi:hypothetical protein